MQKNIGAFEIFNEQCLKFHLNETTNSSFKNRLTRSLHFWHSEVYSAMNIEQNLRIFSAKLEPPKLAPQPGRAQVSHLNYVKLLGKQNLGQ